MSREQRTLDLLDELTAHRPADVIRSLRSWHGGPLSLIHLHVLALLEHDGPSTMRGLAEALDASQASATGIVDRMEQRGLVERRRDPDDRRVVRVVPTEAGRALGAGVASARRERLGRVLAELSDEDLDHLLLGARALHRAFERVHGPHTGDGA